MPSVYALQAGPKGFARGLATDLEGVVGAARPGDIVHLDSTHPMLDAALFRWCRAAGHALVEKTPLPGAGVRYVIRIAGPPDVAEDEAEDPAHRLWIYTNLNCNLSCDYCCVRSSPRAAPAQMGLDEIRRIASEAPSLGFRRIILTGGEPFLRADLDEVVLACAVHLPTTVLTNAMLFEGPRRAILDRLPRERVTLQVSLDSPDASLHDSHRGAGSWERARSGVKIARSLGFRVRIAATTHTAEQADAMRAFLAAEGVSPEDRVVRPVALRGEAKDGIPLLRNELRPEITFTTEGVYWHPVGATDADFRVLPPAATVAQAVNAVREIETRDRAGSDRLAAVFHCS